LEKFDSIIQFIRKVYSKPYGYIPLHSPVFKGNEKKYLEDCIDTTYVSSVGKYVDLFEEMVASYTGARKAVACVNGTNALHMALILSGVKQNEEVITQPLTFIATANAITYCEAHPVFLDVDIDTLGLSPAKLENWLKQNVVFKNDQTSKSENLNPQPYNKVSGRRISAIVPMHTFGHPCRIDEIVEIGEKYHIPVVEDAAESMGSWYKNRHTGTFGKIGVLSFNGNKIITTGGGGMLLFADIDLAKRCKHLTTQAKIPHEWEFSHDETGYNYRMPNINAALGCAQMENLKEYIEYKRKIAESYSAFFASNTECKFFQEPDNSKSNYWLNSIFFKNRIERDSFLQYSNSQSVMCRPTWKLMNKLPMYIQSQSGDLTTAEKIADRLINIPSSCF
jgi:perosamine synthetase